MEARYAHEAASRYLSEKKNGNHSINLLSVNNVGMHSRNIKQTLHELQ